MIVVSGVTGNTGRAVARALRGVGESVVGLSRRGDAQVDGVELVRQDLSDGPGLAARLKGAKAFYAVLPPQWAAPDYFEAQRPALEGLVHAIQTAELPRVVVLSSVAVQVPEGTGPIRGLRPLEAALQGRPGLTFLRAAYFVENLVGVLGPVRQGQLPVFWEPGQRVEMVSVSDIGAEAARLLRQAPQEAPAVVQLSGPQDHSFVEVAQGFEALLGHSVAPLPLPAHAIVPGLRELGAGHLAELYAELNQGMAEGRLTFEEGIPLTRGQTPLAQSLAGLLKAAGPA